MRSGYIFMTGANRLFRAAIVLVLFTIPSFLVWIYWKALLLDRAIVGVTSYPDDSVNMHYVRLAATDNFKPLEVIQIHAWGWKEKEDDVLVLDFGKAAFGALLLRVEPSTEPYDILVSLGEKLSPDGRVWFPTPGVDRFPSQIAHYTTRVHVDAGMSEVLVEGPERFRPEPKDLPGGLKAVFPFRFAEVRGAENRLIPTKSAQLMIRYPADFGVSSFTSSNSTINDVWEFSKHTIEATTFAGIFVDGNRERKPYEADAYINQLGYYSVTNDFVLPRRTIQYLIQNPTWPTEWLMHVVAMAYEDYMRTGDSTFLSEIYESIRSRVLDQLARNDGLIQTNNAEVSLINGDVKLNWKIKDIVDWPPAERDNFQKVKIDGIHFFLRSISYYLRLVRAYFVRFVGFYAASDIYFNDAKLVGESRFELPEINSVVNMLHFDILRKMSEIATVLGRNDDASYFLVRSEKVNTSIRNIFFSQKKGLFVDGEGGDHASLHSNMYALAFGVAPVESKAKIFELIENKGLACSVFGAQFLLEGLFKARNPYIALDLLASKDERSWWAMKSVSGSTMTMESWSNQVNPDSDWNHAWGTAPLNIITRWLVGVRTKLAGNSIITIDPQPGDLKFFKARVPIGKAEVSVEYIHSDEKNVQLSFELPPGLAAEVHFPLPDVAVYSIVGGNGYVASVQGPGSIRLGIFVGGKHVAIARKVN